VCDWRLCAISKTSAFAVSVFLHLPRSHRIATKQFAYDIEIQTQDEPNVASLAEKRQSRLLLYL
jgi:hypothetical protein